MVTGIDLELHIYIYISLFSLSLLRRLFQVSFRPAAVLLHFDGVAPRSSGFQSTSDFRG